MTVYSATSYTVSSHRTLPTMSSTMLSSAESPGKQELEDRIAKLEKVVEDLKDSLTENSASLPMVKTSQEVHTESGNKLKQSSEVGSLPGDKHQPEVPPNAIRDIIKAAMEAENVRERDIPTEHSFATPEDGDYSKRYFEVKGFA